MWINGFLGFKKGVTLNEVITHYRAVIAKFGVRLDILVVLLKTQYAIKFTIAKAAILSCNFWWQPVKSKKYVKNIGSPANLLLQTSVPK